VPILIAAYKKNGYEVWDEHYERGTKEFTPLLLRMMASRDEITQVRSNRS